MPRMQALVRPETRVNVEVKQSDTEGQLGGRTRKAETPGRKSCEETQKSFQEDNQGDRGRNVKKLSQA